MHYRDAHHVASDTASGGHIHQTPDLYQRHMKHNLAIFHIDLKYHFELMLRL